MLDVSEIIAITDAFVICSGSTDRQLKAIAEGIERALAGEGVKPVRREGERELRWLLLDYVDFIVHIFLDEARAFYELERLWKDAPALEWQAATQTPSRRAHER